MTSQPKRSVRTPSDALGARPRVLTPRDGDPLDADLTFDDVTMLGFALVAILGVIALLALGF